MGVKIFREDNWNRIKNGVILRRDIMHLDGEKDRRLIGYLITHAPESARSSMMNYAAEYYGMDELPETFENIDDPNDSSYEEYYVLKEQVVREDDAEQLKAAALQNPEYDLAAFAFCRLTGCRFPLNECDAYSYRTYDCGRMPLMTEEDVRAFCRMVIRKGGRFADLTAPSD